MAAQPEPWKSLRAALEAMEGRLRRLENRSPFFGTGLTPQTGAPVAFDPGMVPNDALTSPSSPQAVYDYAQSFSIPSGPLTNVKTVTIAVPSGFTSASVTLTVRCEGINSTAGLDYLFSQANINGFNGFALPTAASASGGSCLNVSTFAVVLSGATLGSSLVLQAAVGTQFGTWASSASNIADIAASITWYR